MKYCVIVPDGMSGYPMDRFDGRTALEIARTPNLDEVAKLGVLGMVQTIAKGMAPGSDVANLSLLGYDPRTYYSGRAPLEAASIGVELAESEWAFRCNLVTADEDVMADFTAGHIRTNEAQVLIELLNEKLGSDEIAFHPGVSYRNLMVYSGGRPMDMDTTPPHDITGQRMKPHMPRGRGAEVIVDLMQRSRELLAGHDVNVVRTDLEENPANMIWLWGQGQRPNIPAFEERFGLRGAAVAAVDLVKGIAACLGWKSIDVPGATGYLDTNYKGKGEAAIQALDEFDFVFVHIEAPDEAGHEGEAEKKVRAIESVDRLVIGPVHEAMGKLDEYRLLVMPDHRTPVEVRTHTSDPVPFAYCGTGVQGGSATAFGETEAVKTGVIVDEGHALMGIFLGKG